jgi:uncharacterized membrane protein (DUF4010 family)
MDAAGLAWDFSWLDGQSLGRLPEFMTALAIGLMMGLERERNPSARAGLRTFALVALFGAVCAVLADSLRSPALVATGLAALALMMVGTYLRPSPPGSEGSDDPGTTTMVAVLACFVLAVMALSGQTRLAVMLAIVATALMYFKAELRGMAQHLTQRDLLSMLQFAVVTFIVLPVLPDADFGPYDALNLRQIWWMVVLISGVSLAGYVALRVVGQAHGAVLLGLLGGLVSSTATTLAYSRHTHNDAAMLPLAARVILMANMVLLARLAVLTSVVAQDALRGVLPVLGCGFALGAAAFAIDGLRSRGKAQRTLGLPQVNNPTELRAALGFAGLYALVLLLTAWLGDAAGPLGVYAVAVASGLTDVDAITLSSLRLFDTGSLTLGQVSTAIALAVSANVAFKLALVGFVAGRALLAACLPAMLAVAAGVLAAAWLLG